MTAMRKYVQWWLPALFLLIFAPFSPYLDLKISHYFYAAGHFEKNEFIQTGYFLGFALADTIVVLASCVLLFSLVIPFLKKFRAPAMMLVLTMVLGSGVVVHLILKDHWGRPRPAQVKEFGGKHDFRPFYQPYFNAPVAYKSFPCGHCTGGFYFLVFVVLGQRYHKKSLIYLGILLTSVLGASLAYSRMASGGHFFSDVIVSALVMWWTALFLDWLIYCKKPQEVN